MLIIQHSLNFGKPFFQKTVKLFAKPSKFMAFHVHFSHVCTSNIFETLSHLSSQRLPFATNSPLHRTYSVSNNRVPPSEKRFSPKACGLRESFATPRTAWPVRAMPQIAGCLIIPQISHSCTALWIYNPLAFPGRGGNKFEILLPPAKGDRRGFNAPRQAGSSISADRDCCSRTAPWRSSS